MSTLATPRVQIIDPDAAFRETLASYLRSCGYWVETCGNLDEGLGQAAHANFDLILVENALLETVRDHLKEWARELHVLNAFSSAICSTLDTREIIALVNSELAKLIRYDLCTLTLPQGPQVQIHFHATLPIMHRLVETIVEDF